MSNIDELHTKRCVACEGGIKPLDKTEIDILLRQIPAWVIDIKNTNNTNNMRITRKFVFKNFYLTMSFVNAVAWIANQENHHPDMEVGYNYCVLNYSTHAINGISQNDFICAAKVDALII